MPAWYPSIHAALPKRFSAVAPTLAIEQQRWFVAISPTDGKTLEIHLSVGGYSTEPMTTIDATGTWIETARGWSVQTPTGLFIEVRCGIGAEDVDAVGPRNYCDLAGTGAFTKIDIRSVASALATSLSPATFEALIDPPQPVTLDRTAALGLIAAAVPDQPLAGDKDWGQLGSDHIFEFGTDLVRPSTSVRILHGCTHHRRRPRRRRGRCTTTRRHSGCSGPEGSRCG